MLFEGFGVGLLVPLLNLLLGGDRATPMRPLQWLERTLPGHSPAFYIGAIAVAIILSVALKNAAFYTSLVLAARLKRRIAVRLRDDLFRRLHRADLDLFDRLPGGDLANVFLVETYRTTVAIDAMLALIQRTSIAFFYVAALFFLSWSLTSLVVLLAVALGGALSFVYGRLKSVGVELTDLNHRMASMLGQSFSGVRIVRATHSQDRELEQFHALNQAQADAEQRSAEALSLLFPITETLAVAGAMVIVTCAYIFLVRPGYMLSSYLLAYGFVLLRLLPLLNQLYGLHGHLAYLAGGIHEVKTWLDTPHFPERPFGTVPFTGLEQALAFEHVTYKYPNGKTALEDIDFVVPVGQTIAIVGPSGAGKSTLANILLRLRAPSGGRVTVDGRDCWEFSSESWHRATALVEQDAFLFHGTLRENILYGCEPVGDAALDSRPHRRPPDRRRLVASGWAGHARGRARSDGVRRSAAADRHRARRHPQPERPHPGRGDLTPRRRLRTAGPAGPPERLTRPNHHRHRPPSLDDSGRRSPDRARPGPDRGAGNLGHPRDRRGCLRAPHPRVGVNQAVDWREISRLRAHGSRLRAQQDPRDTAARTVLL